METQILYLVMSTYMGDAVRYISQDYEKAFAKAEEVVALENKAVDHLNKAMPSCDHEYLEQVFEIGSEPLFGERMLAYWENSHRAVKIVDSKPIPNTRLNT